MDDYYRMSIYAMPTATTTLTNTDNGLEADMELLQTALVSQPRTRFVPCFVSCAAFDNFRYALALGQAVGRKVVAVQGATTTRAVVFFHLKIVV